MSGYVSALRATVRASIGKLYKAEGAAPSDEDLRKAKREGIAEIRAVKASMPLQQKLKRARQNAAQLGARKYHDV